MQYLAWNHTEKLWKGAKFSPAQKNNEHKESNSKANNADKGGNPIQTHLPYCNWKAKHRMDITSRETDDDGQHILI